MTTQLVIRDKDGSVINIGPWDYVEETITDDESGESTVIQHNPLPEGATISEEEIVTLSDGGLAAASDVPTDTSE